MKDDIKNQSNLPVSIPANVQNNDMRMFLVSDDRLAEGTQSGLYTGDIVSGASISIEQFAALEGEIIAAIVTSKGVTLFCKINPLTSILVKTEKAPSAEAAKYEDVIFCTFPNTNYKPIALPVNEIAEIYHITEIDYRNLDFHG